MSVLLSAFFSTSSVSAQKFWYFDGDGDGCGDPAVERVSPKPLPGFVANNLDCDDRNPKINGCGAVEVCDGFDNDCDGMVDDGLVATWYLDGDADGFGNPAMSLQACAPPPGYVALGTDCDDANAQVYPGLEESCDDLDNDCDDAVDEDGICPRDSDGDGVPDPLDVCMFVPDAGQLDRDADGVGDACDSCPDAPGAGSGCPGVESTRGDVELLGVDTNGDGVADETNYGLGEGLGGVVTSGEKRFETADRVTGTVSADGEISGDLDRGESGLLRFPAPCCGTFVIGLFGSLTFQTDGLSVTIELLDGAFVSFYEGGKNVRITVEEGSGTLVVHPDGSWTITGGEEGVTIGHRNPPTPGLRDISIGCSPRDTTTVPAGETLSGRGMRVDSPSKNDLDDDGVEDGQDNCRFVPNADQADGDGDGVGDECDFCRAGEPLPEGCSDPDGDGVADFCDGCTPDECTPDNCPGIPNADQADGDGDGIGDPCDADADGDDVLDGGDNCPFLSNPGQADTDEDGVGDDCDSCPFEAPCVDCPDEDLDGVFETCPGCPPEACTPDNCPEVPNPEQEDDDGDGVGDDCDSCPTIPAETLTGCPPGFSRTHGDVTWVPQTGNAVGLLLGVGGEIQDDDGNQLTVMEGTLKILTEMMEKIHAETQTAIFRWRGAGGGTFTGILGPGALVDVQVPRKDIFYETDCSSQCDCFWYDEPESPLRTITKTTPIGQITAKSFECGCVGADFTCVGFLHRQCRIRCQNTHDADGGAIRNFDIDDDDCKELRTCDREESTDDVIVIPLAGSVSIECTSGEAAGEDRCWPVHVANDEGLIPVNGALIETSTGEVTLEVTGISETAAFESVVVDGVDLGGEGALPINALILAPLSREWAGRDETSSPAVDFEPLPPRDDDGDGAVDVLVVGPGPFFRRGDSNNDGGSDISDAVYELSYLFLGGPPPDCLESADINDDGSVDISDAIALLGHLFLGAPPPEEPFAACGSDPTEDELTCEAFGGCP